MDALTKMKNNALKMQRINLAAQKNNPIEAKPKGTNYLSPQEILSLDKISSVKNDRAYFDKVISKTLMKMIMDGDTDDIKLKAIDRFIKLSSENKLLIKSGDTQVIADTEGVTSLNLDFSAFKTDEAVEPHAKTTKTRDLIRNKFSSPPSIEHIEDQVEEATFEVIDG